MPSAPDIRTELPGPKARAHVAYDETWTSPSLPRAYPNVPVRGDGLTMCALIAGLLALYVVVRVWLLYRESESERAEAAYWAVLYKAALNNPPSSVLTFWFLVLDPWHKPPDADPVALKQTVP